MFDTSAWRGNGGSAFVPRVFISHSSHDNTFGLELLHSFQQAGIDAWYDKDGKPENVFASGLAPGDIWTKRIETEIAARNIYILILSPAALNSPWVTLEHRVALMDAVSKNKVIIPVVASEIEVKTVSPFISAYQFISFLAPRTFDAAFAALLAAIRQGETPSHFMGAPGQQSLPPLDIARLPQLDQFVGRREEIQSAIERLSLAGTDSRPAFGIASISAVNGMAGIGKSALAAAVLRTGFLQGLFPDGMAVVKANEIRSPNTLLQLALDRFGVRGADVDTADLSHLMEIVRATFYNKRALIVFDNMEIDGTWRVKDAIAPLRASGLAILITSRREPPVDAVPPEANVPLRNLPVDEAVEVFARFYRPAEQTVSEHERRDIVRIVNALGAHTLAVKLAATNARRHERPLNILADEFERNPRLKDLQDGSDDIEAVFDETYTSLGEPEQRLLVALAGFASLDIGRRAVLNLAARLESNDPQTSLAKLVDLHLLEPFSLNAGSSSTRWDSERVRLHPLIHTYILDRFAGKPGISLTASPAEAPWSDQTRMRVQRYIVEWFAEYVNWDGITAPDLSVDELNINGAYELASVMLRDSDLTAEIAYGMRNYWRDRMSQEQAMSYLKEGVAAAEKALDSTQRSLDMEDISEATMRAVRLELVLGQCVMLRGASLKGQNPLECERLLAQASTIYMRNMGRREDIEGQPGIGVVRQGLGRIELERDNLESARNWLDLALKLHQQEGDEINVGQDLALKGRVAEAEAQFLVAKDFYEQALAIQLAAPDTQGAAYTQLLLGKLLVAVLNDHQTGCQHLRAAAEAFAYLRHPKEVAVRDVMKAYQCDQRG